MEQSRPAREGAQMTAQDRARLRDVLAVNPFDDKHYVAQSIWYAMALCERGLTDGEGDRRDDIVDEARRFAKNLHRKRPVFDTFSRELRGRDTGERDTVRTKLEAQGFSLVAERGKVRIEVLTGNAQPLARALGVL